MKLNVKDIAIFGMLGAVMYASDILMELFPNIHLVGVFIVAITVVYRKKALCPIYIYVFISGIFGGFATWWIPYLYVWTVLWAMVMLLPKKIPEKVKPIVYMFICGLHGLLFGIIYAPAQAILFGLDFEGMKAWILSGLPFDAIHAVSNFFFGILIYPITRILQRAEKITQKY